MRSRLAHLTPWAIAALGLTAVSCGPDGAAGERSPDDTQIVVAAAFAPIEDVVRAVGGDAVDVVALTPAGQEAHDAQLTPQRLDRLSDSRLAVYLGNGFQPSVEKAIAELDDDTVRLDLLDRLQASTDDDGLDPHVWLDPTNMARMADAVANALAGVDPAGAASYRERAAAYAGELLALDEAMSAGLASCASRVFVTSHHAFGYLAARYQLMEIAIAGQEPEEEPSAKSLEAIAERARRMNVRTIYFEPNLPKSLAGIVADEVGAATAVLDPFETRTAAQARAGWTYVAAQRSNLAALRTGLGCT
jgi:zinc transport system substrate-binding protein